uniref:Uncharacterized protein n=1 Tax=Toxoplasma gondii COUG TaxID=1074873 RepID=A0A2G8Y557_TOXGO|nr:hypothetical protein TGCOUG_205425 [Toxoplasma gondii COUG]
MNGPSTNGRPTGGLTASSITVNKNDENSELYYQIAQLPGGKGVDFEAVVVKDMCAAVTRRPSCPNAVLDRGELTVIQHSNISTQNFDGYRCMGQQLSWLYAGVDRQSSHR